jgi:hypothetical protein
VTDPNTQLLLNIIYAIGGWIPAIIGARLHDIVGRRKMLMGATAGMAVCLAIAAGTAADFIQTGSRQASVASITFIYIFGSVFALAFTSMQPIYPGEVLSNDMRGKGMGVFQLTSGCAGFVNTFAAPVALNNVSEPGLDCIKAEATVLTRYTRSATGFTSSSSSGTVSSLRSSIFSSLRQSPGLWKTWMLPVRGRIVRIMLQRRWSSWVCSDSRQACKKKRRLRSYSKDQ